MSTVVAIHQPNYLPWIGYFHKILRADTFVYLDSVEFNSDSLTHRNKIKTPDGEHLLTVPISGSSSADIANLEIDTSKRWQRNHRKSIEVHYTNATYFDEFEDLISIYEDYEWTNLAELNITIIDHLIDTLGIETELIRSSDMSVGGSKTELLVDICETLSADVYFSGSGGRDYHDESLFDEAGIDIVYQEFTHPEYPQQFGEFIPKLSFIDALFNVGAEGGRDLLRSL